MQKRNGFIPCMLTDTDIFAKRFQWTLSLINSTKNMQRVLRQRNADDEIDVEGLIA